MAPPHPYFVVNDVLIELCWFILRDSLRAFCRCRKLVWRKRFTAAKAATPASSNFGSKVSVPGWKDDTVLVLSEFPPPTFSSSIPFWGFLIVPQVATKFGFCKLQPEMSKKLGLPRSNAFCLISFISWKVRRLHRHPHHVQADRRYHRLAPATQSSLRLAASRKPSSILHPYLTAHRIHHLPTVQSMQSTPFWRWLSFLFWGGLEESFRL